jgi:hypothetical protein
MKILILIFTSFFAVAVHAQSPVQWEFKAKKLEGQRYEVTLTANIKGSWHIYSQFTPDGGPLPTEIKFNRNPLLVMNGAVKEVGKLYEKHEEVFDINVKFYSGKVEFKQLVTLKSKVKTKISGTVSYMVCDDTQCLPPKKESFSIAL